MNVFLVWIKIYLKKKKIMHNKVKKKKRLFLKTIMYYVLLKCVYFYGAYINKVYSKGI